LGRVLPEPLDLGPGTKPLVLTDLDPSDTRRELEFHLPLAHPSTGSFAWGDRSFVIHPGFLTGRIDLIFRWEGGLYLADWKTNRLAPGQDPRDLMAEAGYDLQAQWYWEALGRLCRTQGEVLVPRGVLYIFLRGPDDRPRGVFLSPEDLDRRTTLRRFLEKEPVHG
jgi:ATP-dependent exoDNAse (exonuclease V) beta subunit